MGNISNKSEKGDRSLNVKETEPYSSPIRGLNLRLGPRKAKKKGFRGRGAKENWEWVWKVRRAEKKRV